MAHPQPVTKNHTGGASNDTMGRDGETEKKPQNQGQRVNENKINFNNNCNNNNNSIGLKRK